MAIWFRKFVALILVILSVLLVIYMGISVGIFAGVLISRKGDMGSGFAAIASMFWAPFSAFIAYWIALKARELIKNVYSGQELLMMKRVVIGLYIAVMVPAFIWAFLKQL